MNKNKKILLYLCIAIFLIAGIYFTFIASNINQYDSQVRAYDIYPNESYDSDDGTIYRPIYYFEVNGRNYECETKSGSSFYPDENKNKVYYDSSDPTKCKTEYDKSSSKLAGVICLIVTAIIVYFYIIKKPSKNIEEFNREHEDLERQYQFKQENAEKIIGIVERVQLIYKRIILGIIIVVLLVFTLIDTVIFKQTIKSRNYVETIATYVSEKDALGDELFVDHIYVFVDKDGRQQEVLISLPKDGSISPESKITVKYNEKNPQDYYEEGSTFDKTGMIWYIVKLVVLILLMVLFFNKKILNKINIFASLNRN